MVLMSGGQDEWCCPRKRSICESSWCKGFDCWERSWAEKLWIRWMRSCWNLFWPCDKWKPCSYGVYRRWRTCYHGDEVRRVESMSHSAIATFLTNCEINRSKMLLELSVILVENCKRFLPPPLPVVHTCNGIQWAKDDKDATYLSLCQNISLQNALMPAQATKNFLREYHKIIHVHLWIKIWSSDQCTLVVAYTFRHLKWNHFTGLVAESLKFILKTQQGLCDHCELLPVGKGSCCV